MSARHAVKAEVRLYNELFTESDPDNVTNETDTYLDNLNPESLEVLTGCCAEPCIAAASVGDKVQFERTGYFCVDPDSTAEHPVFNRTVGLRDTWKNIQKRD